MPHTLRILLSGSAVIAVLMIATYQLRSPFWNWDMLPYMAAAVELDGCPIPAAHDTAYDEAARRLSPGTFDQLVDTHNPYRSTLRSDRQAFADQLPLYWIKPLYVASVWAAWKCGATLPRATVWPSFFGFLLTGFALFRLFRREVPQHMAAALTALLLLLPCVNESAGLSTPDALSAGLVLLAVAELTGDGLRMGIALLALAIATRADNGIVAAVLLLARPWYAPHQRTPLLSVGLGAAALLATYLVVDRIGCAHGWCVRPATAFAPRSLHPGSEVVLMTWNTYTEAVRNGAASLPYTWVVEFASLLALALVLALVPVRRSSATTAWRTMVVITCAMVVRYAFFPVPDDRALLPCYGVITVALAAAVRRILPQRWLTAP